MSKLTGTETEVLVPAPRMSAIAPASTATWQRVEGFLRHETGEVYAVRLVGQLLVRRTHVVLAGR